MEKIIIVKIDGKDFEFENNYKATVVELLALVNTNTTKSVLQYKNNASQPKYKELGDSDSLKLKEGMILKSMPKTITDGEH